MAFNLMFSLPSLSLLLNLPITWVKRAKRGGLKVQKFNRKYKAKLEFLEGRVGRRENSSHVGAGMVQW